MSGSRLRWVGMRGFCCLWIALVCSSLTAWAQQPAPPDGPGGQHQTPASLPARGEAHRIALDVVVNDRSGKPVPGLEQRDFTVLSDKTRQDILSFQAISGTSSAAKEGSSAQEETKIVLLLDTVNTSFQSVSYEREQIERFLRQSNAQLPQPISIMLFTDTGTQILSGFSRDRDGLIAALEKSKIQLRILRRSAGFYGAVERFQLSLRTLQSLTAREATYPGRKLLIWISPGWPLLTGPRVELTPREQQGLFQSIVQTSQALRQARVTLYSVDPVGAGDTGFRTFYYEEFLKGVSAPNQAEAGNLGLQVLADQSGGLVLTSSNDVAGQIARCAQDATAYYRISIAAATTEHRDEYHKLQVVIDKPGLTARTSTGYYAQP